MVSEAEMCVFCICKAMFGVWIAARADILEGFSRILQRCQRVLCINYARLA